MRFFSLLIILMWSYCLYAQPDTTAMIKAVETKLQGGATVSGILTDKNHLGLHPKTPFRELIKQYATTTPLKITTSEEPGKKIRVVCVVSNKEGKPVAGALVYLYQTDSRGWYAADAPHVLAYEGDHRH